jgi:VanZ family protein
MRYKYSSALKALFWTALIASYLAALVPQEIAPRFGSLSDKGAHFIAFAVLTILLQMAYTPIWIKTFLWLLSYAVWIEISQLFTSDRSSEMLDVIADAIGIVIGLTVYFIIRILIMRKYLFSR